MKKRLFKLAIAGNLLLMSGCSDKNTTVIDKSTDTQTITQAITQAVAEVSSEEAVEITPERIYPDNSFKDVPEEYIENNAVPKGSVVRFTYDTSDPIDFNDNKEIYQKSALVYLPACYDEDDSEAKYNVLYLMHGGSDSPEWFFGGEGGSTQITQIIDSMIANGDMEPVIICAVSYYNEYCHNDTTNCINFHHELITDIIPEFEEKYHTYAENTSPDGLKESRYHRAFGGFSMGAVTTWSVFENRLNEIAYFLPMSGDCWSLGSTAGGSRPVETAEWLSSKVKEQGFNANEFFIYSGCGGYDMAEPNLTPQINSMKELSDTFIYCDNFADGNLYQCIYPQGGHDRNTVARILYNGLPKMFG